ncbi:MAG: iron ABC transporter permease [Lachnospiraceae bacterium]|nr:iron ABC transporter permease [Lachnospiraceae bacterium]
MKGNKIREGLLFPVLTAILGISILYVVSIGTTPIDMKTVYHIMVDQIFLGGKETNAGVWDNASYQIIWNIRLPRVLFGVCCGAGLSICGAAMQALVLNPVAEPYILGVSSGASAGAAFALLVPIPLFSGQYRTTTFALLGAILAFFCVYNMSKAGGGGKIQPVTLLLSGTAVNAVMSAITSFLIFMAKSQESISAVYNWQMGSLASAQWNSLWVPAIGVALGCIIFIWQSGNFNLIMMGDEDAAAMGLNVKRFRGSMFIICAIIVASLVSITGIIGFVGLMIPHIVRLLAKTSNNKVVLPLSALFGASYLIWADAAARSLFGAAELPLGIITAFVGAPFFFYLMLRKNRGAA